MTANIVLPPLKSWATSHLTSLITAAPNKDAFDTAFDFFVAKDAKITFNGVPQTRDQYKDLLKKEQFLEEGATINIKDVVVAATLGTQETQTSGLVGIFYDASYFEEIRIRDAAVTHSVQSSLNILVSQDESIPTPPFRGFVDKRRAFQIDQISLDVRGLIDSDANN